MPSSSFKLAVALCNNISKLTESELLLQMSAILKSNADVVQEKYRTGKTLFHYAATCGRSPEFCQQLIEANPDLVKTADNNGKLPFHFACSQKNIQTAKFLYQKYPESINILADNGHYPLHMLLLASHIGRLEDTIELLQFLLEHDQGAVSSIIRDIDGETTALHIACQDPSESLEIVKLVFDAYPKAIYIEDDIGSSPIDVASHEMIEFLDHQLDLEYQARQDRTPDSNGELPIHRALYNRDTSVGGIKLMMAANPASINETNTHGHNLLHIACQSSKLGTIKYLVGCDSDGDLLKTLDNNENLPLHHACLGGNFDVIAFIHEQSTFGVILQNSDKRTPIELLLYESECDRNSMEYVEAVRCLLRANPVDTLKCLAKKDESTTNNQGQDAGTKRRRV
eukprot:scaffold43406_cov36-Cyclotella_meneghiniana.AAC.2